MAYRCRVRKFVKRRRFGFPRPASGQKGAGGSVGWRVVWRVGKGLDNLACVRLVSSGLATASLLLLCLVAGCGGSPDSREGLSDTTSTPTTDQRSTLPKTTSPKPADPPPFDRQAEIAKCEQLLAAGKLPEAAQVLRGVLLVDPMDVEALFRLGNVQAAMGDLSGAVELLDSIPPDHPEAGLPALGQSADWCFQLARYDDAERRYLKVVERVPNLGVARRQLAYLYNRQGRRHEAAEQIQVLCKLGDVRQDELHALMVLGNAVYQDPNTQPAAGDRPYWPIGPAAEARKLYTDYKFAEAAELLHGSIVEGKVPPSVLAFYGRLAAESQDDQRFLWWLGRTNEATREFSEYWAALGTYLVNHRKFDEAVRALSEAIDRDPTDAASMQRLNESLLALGKPEEAERWFQRYSTIRATTLASNRIGQTTPPDPNDFQLVCEGLIKLDRPLESVMWAMAGAFQQKLPKEAVEQLKSNWKSIVKSGDGFPDQTERLCGLRKEDFPLSKLKGTDSDALVIKSRAKDNSLQPARFENVAGQIGLRHTYKIASDPQAFRFALYQTLGGGVAVTDYDLDGRCDLFFAQGASDPPSFRSDESSIFYRNLDERLDDVTTAAGVLDQRYSIGTTSGDWNQDGFPDLVKSCIGGSVLMTNNGDGTFTSTDLSPSQDMNVLPSSVAIADVTGDSLPEIIEVLYVADAKMTQQPPLDADGNVIGVAVAEYKPAKDRLYINDGRGGFQTQAIGEDNDAASTGLGIVVTDFDGKPGNEIFVGNDIRANHYWVRDRAGNWSDLAPLAGCAFGNGGIMTASMGIAAADFNGSGSADLHVTNFFLEPASFFINRGGSFEDRAIQFGIAGVSRRVLGFGTQAIDYDNDGNRDLVVTNGHIEKPSNPDEPFQQKPQLFANLGGRFQLADVDDPSDYFPSLHLGRGLARLDFNQDGKSDFVVTHIGTASALMINQTETDHHWLSITLVGTESERDCVGAKVQVRAGEQLWSDWAMGGDGYLAHNESNLLFGLGDANAVDEVTVTWPSGQLQTFRNIDVDRRLLLIENQDDPFEY